ncbi:MAG: glycerate kinase [Anaerolineae bacterium]
MSEALSTLRAVARRIIGEALAAVDPGPAVRRFVQRRGHLLAVGEQTYDLNDYDRLRVIGAGKAGAPMAQAIAELLPDRLTDGLVIVKYGHRLSGATAAGPVEIVEAGHPLPDRNSLHQTRRLVELLADSTERDLVICLISGGGSALLTLPVKPVSLAQLQTLTGLLLRCGATINEINTIRKHLSQVKGGGLARLAAPATLISLILSDVIGDPLDIIASGPTAPDPSTFIDALSILEKYNLLAGQAGTPDAIRQHLRAGQAGHIPETPKPGDLRFSRVQNIIIGNNRLAARAAEAAARAQGFNALLLTTYVEGEAREVGKMVAALARRLAGDDGLIGRPACLIFGGETTVTVRGDGLGGRNQEMALSASLALAGCPAVLVACLGTDGSDGPTDAAGAFADGQTVARARALGLDAADYLARNDSYHFFQALGDLIITGPTGTNVNDLTFIFAR